MKYINCALCLTVIGSLFISTSVQAQVACPSADINAVMADSVVNTAMDTAWTNSNEGTATEHEEGFYIYQCRTEAGDGYTYTTEVDFGVGTVSSLLLPSIRADTSCRLVGDFHTHPGIDPSDPNSNDPYQNHVPSTQDFSSGIPGIITYGLGPDRGTGNTTDITYGPAENPNLSWSCEEESESTEPPKPVSYNDPHLITPDGLAYDFQSVGEFTLVKSDLGEFIIQSRQQPYGGAGTHVSMNTAFAFLVVEDEVTVQFDSSNTLRIFLNGEELFLQGEQELPAGGNVTVETGQIDIIWPDQTHARIRVRSQFLNLSLVIARRHAGAISGLLGNFDGDSENDLMTGDGTDLTTMPAAGELYGIYTDGWRISDNTSMFVYFGNENTEFFSDRLFPGRIISISDLSEADRQSALEVCSNQGIVDDVLLQNCILDVGLSGDEEFAIATIDFQEELTSELTVAEVQGQIEVPVSACEAPATTDILGLPIPDFSGRFIGLLTNPDSNTNWDAVFDVEQCGVDVTGVMRITAQRSQADVYLRRFSGNWADSQLTIQWAFPYQYTNYGSLNPCLNMAAILNYADDNLSGSWTADNCPRGGVFDVTRE